MIGVSVMTSANGINQNLLFTDNILVYPNPTYDQFIVETNSADKMTIQLFDLNGRLLFVKSVNGKEKIDIANLNEGVYTLTIKSTDKIVNRKLAIIH